MRVAICFSGHLRNFFNNSVNLLKDKIQNFEKQQNKVDLFFSIWDTYEPYNSWSNTEIKSNKIDVSQIEKLNPISYEIEVYDDIKSQFLYSNFNSNIKIENEKLMSEGILHSTPMYYKIMKANSLKSLYEATYNFKYDVVIRYRANIDFEKDLDFNHLKYNIIYNRASGYNCYDNRNCMCDDIFAYGQSDIMNKYSDVYNNLSMIYKKYGNTGPERILYDWLVKENNISIEVDPIGFIFTR
jgi:hypothetical protein